MTRTLSLSHHITPHRITAHNGKQLYTVISQQLCSDTASSHRRVLQLLLVCPKAKCHFRDCGNYINMVFLKMRMKNRAWMQRHRVFMRTRASPRWCHLTLQIWELNCQKLHLDERQQSAETRCLFWHNQDWRNITVFMISMATSLEAETSSW